MLLDAGSRRRVRPASGRSLVMWGLWTRRAADKGQKQGSGVREKDNAREEGTSRALRRSGCLLTPDSRPLGLEPDRDARPEAVEEAVDVVPLRRHVEGVEID